MAFGSPVLQDEQDGNQGNFKNCERDNNEIVVHFISSGVIAPAVLLINLPTRTLICGLDLDLFHVFSRRPNPLSCVHGHPCVLLVLEVSGLQPCLSSGFEQEGFPLVKLQSLLSAVFSLPVVADAVE